MSRERDELVELITRKVMESLSGAPLHEAPAPLPSPRVPATEHDAETCERCRSWGVNAARGPEDTRALAEAGA